MNDARMLRVAHLYPELLNLYGDSGNILVLRKRMEWRGIVCDVREVHVGETPTFGDVDIAFIGGGSDREQRIVRGLSLVDLYTDRGSPRLIGNIMVESRISPQPLVGYENHAGRTHLGPDVEPMGTVIHGFGNDGTTGEEGCLYKNVVGTYVHGPLLPKNPGVADYLISRALERRYGSSELEPLDDTVELAANKVMCDRLLSEKAKRE